ncbi:MAG: zinc ribbon domain-containing protein, partial [Acidobacteriota bacterium]
MAIRRCPYCKAIIDESSEYCSNCGTRLLFPEDEFIEEEIPGEKIVDEELKKGKSKLSGRNSSKKEESKLEEKDEDNTELKEDEGELA